MNIKSMQYSLFSISTMLKVVLFATLAVLGHANFAYTQPNSNPNPDPLADLDASISKVMEDWHVPGLAIGIVKNGKILLAKGYGKRNIKNQKAVDENTLFAIGSCTKAFTAFTVAQAVDMGLMDFDEPVKTYLPDFKMYDDHVTNNITVRDMLCHRSGLPRHDLVWYGTPKSRLELVNALVHLEPTADFRTVWQYQNLMFMTAGYLVGKRTQMTWEAFTQKNIFEPLQMKQSNFSVAAMQKNANHATPYSWDEIQKEISVMPFREISAVAPAGAINSNVSEMCNWVNMQLQLGSFNENQLVTPTNFVQMHQPQMTMPSNVTSHELFYSSYGMGWILNSYRGHFRSAHGGNIDGFSANVALFPLDSLGIVVLTNLNGTPVPSILSNIIADRLLQLTPIDWNQRKLEVQKRGLAAAEALKKDQDVLRKPNTRPSHDLVDYVGKYEHPAYGLIELQLRDNQLLILSRGETYQLSHYHYDVFQIKNDEMLGGTKVTFQMDDNGDLQSVEIPLQVGISDIVFERQIDAFQMDLDLYTGEYELLGQFMTIFVENETLKLNIPPQPIYELVPQRAHYFSIKNLEGFSIIFDVKNGRPATSVTFNQPNGVFTAKRKAK